MQFSLFLIVVFGFTALSHAADEPVGKFWIVRAPNNTADSLVEALEREKLQPDVLASRIIALVESKKIRQIGFFTEALSDETVIRKIPNGKISSTKGGAEIELGVTVETQGPVGDSLYADLRTVVEIYEKVSVSSYARTTLYSMHVIEKDCWVMINRWTTENESTLFLARVAAHRPSLAENERPQSTTHLKVELLDMRPEDGLQFRKSTAATRQKAADWLRGRSKVLAAVESTFKSGQKAVREDLIENFQGETSGFTFDLWDIVNGDGSEIDITLAAKWRATLAADAVHQFNIGATFENGVPQLFGPSTALKGKEATKMLLITPLISILNKRSKSATASNDPTTIPDKISTFSYPVAVRFGRIVRGTPEKRDAILLKDALAKYNIEFPAGTSVSHHIEGNTVLLTQTRDGHLKFMELLKKLNLQP